MIETEKKKKEKKRDCEYGMVQNHPSFSLFVVSDQRVHYTS